MIITLTKADFSTCKIGTLTTWNIRRSLGSGATSSSSATTVERDASWTETITLADGYTFGTYSVTMGSTTITPTITENTLTFTISAVTGNINITVATINESTGEDTGGDTGGDTTNEYIIDFDFTQNNLNDYSLDGTFEIPTNSTVSDITYGELGMNLNNNLPNGLILTTPIDSSKAWTLEFTGTFVQPTELVGNRRAFLGGDNLTPFVFMNGNTVDAISFQVSAGSHIYTSASNMIWDSEVTYKFIYNGNGSLELYVNNELKETKTINYTGNFVRILGNIEGKSSAYVWQDVESGKQSWLKTFKFKYNN